MEFARAIWFRKPRYHTPMRRYLGKLPKSTEELLHWYERYISPLTLVVAFTIDTLAFRSVDLQLSSFVLLAYLAIVATAIVLYHLIQTGYLRGNFFLTILPFVPVAMQFGFGGLFSAFVILYSQSAAYAASWIFVIGLALLLIGNERFRKLYTGFVFQASIFFVVLLSFLIFFLPVMLGRIGLEIFLLSEVLGLLVMGGFVYLFAFFAPAIFRVSRFELFRAIASIFLVFNLLYFTNAIPPLPLALKDAGVYHGVRKTGEEYTLRSEPLEWYQRYLRYNTVFHKAPGERAYVFTSIFAPTKLSTTITHEWQFYDTLRKDWRTMSRVSYPIQGGRDGGYRGYTAQDALTPGDWRVNVRIGDGRLVGRVAFEVQNVLSPVSVEEVVR